MPKYSVVIPVFKRRDEVEELFNSLLEQRFQDFEVVIVEDGSPEKCEDLVMSYADRIDIQYFYKQNSGPGLSRNYGIERAKGEYIVLFDSDCLIPANYFEEVEKFLAQNSLDCWGGPDDAHPSFSDTQKAINYTMTSFITTGGIRGKKKQVDKFQPRSFNMGFRKVIYDKIGGFTTLHPGEDPDLSYRMMDAGFTTGLIPDAKVFHKRRIDFGKFWTQVYKFGFVRNVLMKWHPHTKKFIYAFPTLFLFGFLGSVIFSLIFSPLFMLPLALLITIIFFDALLNTKNIKIAFMAIVASFIQLLGYGWGFLKGYVNIHLLGKDERSFKKFFFEEV